MESQIILSTLLLEFHLQFATAWPYNMCLGSLVYYSYFLTPAITAHVFSFATAWNWITTARQILTVFLLFQLALDHLYLQAIVNP